jgi:branched-chain amino acid transport system ATP-binding protein
VTPERAPVLEVTDRVVAYGRGGAGVEHATFTLREGDSIVVLGPNGAGKTSLVRAIGGFLPHEGVSTIGRVRLHGREVLGASPDAIARSGVCVIPERNKIFPNLTVEQNLRVFAGRRRSRSGLAQDMARVTELFPTLQSRMSGLAGYLSGGQQQMLALGGALLARADLLVVDEPSLGLAPILVKEVLMALKQLQAETGIALLLVEQNVWASTHLANRTFTMASGALVEEDQETMRSRLRKQGYVRALS